MKQLNQLTANAVKGGRIPFIMSVLMATFIVVAIVMISAGCGGGSTKSITPASAAGFKQVGAEYVGRTVCSDCHSRINSQYSTRMKGDDLGRHKDDAACHACHVTGGGQPTGGAFDYSVSHLNGIGCESCHGPGSKHVNADSKAERRANITRTPPDTTCIGCHGDRLKVGDDYRPGAMFQPEVRVTAESLASTAPTSIRGPHYAAAAFMLGRKGYDDDAPMPSPHSTMPNTCLNCHNPGIDHDPNDPNPVPHGKSDDPDNTKNVQYPNINTNRDACKSCHGGSRLSEEPLQAGINEWMIKLGGESPTVPGHFDSSMRGGLLGAFATKYNITATSDPTDPKVIAYKGARYNFRYVYGDESLGVHNPGFAKHLLKRVEELLAAADTE